MLIGVSPVISPELLSILHQMGHGDELVLSDAFFPAYSFNGRVIRSDGISVDALLDGILPLITLDEYVASPVIMMDAVSGDTLDPSVERRYRTVIEKHYPKTPATERIERFAFYERAKELLPLLLREKRQNTVILLLKKELPRLNCRIALKI